MNHPAQHRPTLLQFFVATTAASLLALIVPSTAVAASAPPLPPGSLPLALSLQGGLPGGGQDGVSPAADGTICYFGACYNYVAGRQYAWYATGAKVKLWRAGPNLDPADINSHSLQELAVQSVDGLQIVEIGWTVDRDLNGDVAPHLFVFHWIDGIPTCYNGCGFVQTSTQVMPGMRLPPGGFSTFQIEHVGDRWELSLDGTMFGYFPDSLWSAAFTQPLLIQTFGEVASTTTPTCNQMGTGMYAESPASSKIVQFTLLGPTPTPVDLTPFFLVTTPEWYDASHVAPTGFWLGGPGAGRCARH